MSHTRFYSSFSAFVLASHAPARDTRTISIKTVLFTQHGALHLSPHDIRHYTCSHEPALHHVPGGRRMRSPRVLRAASLSVPRVGGARHGRGTAHLAAAGAPSSDLAQSARLSARAGRQQRLDGRAEVGDRVRVPACGLRDVGEGDAVRGDEEEAQWPRGKGALEGVGHPVDVNGEGPRELVHEELGGRAPLRQGGQWRGGGGEGKVVGKEGTGGRASGGGPLAWASVACWLIAHTPGGGQAGNAQLWGGLWRAAEATAGPKAALAALRVVSERPEPPDGPGRQMGCCPQAGQRG